MDQKLALAICDHLTQCIQNKKIKSESVEGIEGLCHLSF
jgi:hypothetical protein